MADMIFISAQPDNVYFHWQVEVYLYQFAKHGILDKCYAVFGYSGNEPSEYIKKLANKYNIFWYKDDRVDKSYAPSIRPHLLKKFFKDKPELGKNVFYHDSDIFIVKLPPFERMLNDDNAYLSDTISYIGYDYLVKCSNRYKEKYPELQDNDLVIKMCEYGEISEELLKENQKNSGGAQYLFKNIDSDFWEKSEISTMKLYDMLKTYQKKYPIEHHVQLWTAGMWAELWEYWKRGGKTIVDKDLDFSWATDDRKKYHTKNIFHLAGVTVKSPPNVFYKAAYKNVNILDMYRANKSLFDYISSDSATIEYTNIIKELVDLTPINNTLFIDTPDRWSGIYEKDQTASYFGMNLWRSTNKKYIIFWNSRCWIVTPSRHEPEISETCGGVASYRDLVRFIKD
jgi:hypothetical protein